MKAERRKVGHNTSIVRRGVASNKESKASGKETTCNVLKYNKAEEKSSMPIKEQESTDERSQTQHKPQRGQMTKRGNWNRNIH